MATLKHFIDAGVFTQEDGTIKVPVRGCPEWGNPPDDGCVTIYTTNAPGLYPIVGVGPGGFAAQYCEHGTIRADVVPGPIGYLMTPQEVEANSLVMPEPVAQNTRYAVLDDDNGLIVETESLEAAQDQFWPFRQDSGAEKLLRMTKSIYLFETGLAVVMEANPLDPTTGEVVDDPDLMEFLGRDEASVEHAAA